MTKKAQTIFTVCFVAFLISVVSLSFVFADSIPHNTETPQITGGYLFSFDVRCVDEDGNLLKNVSFLENGTAWAVDVPEIDGFTPGCTSITRDMVPELVFSRQTVPGCVLWHRRSYTRQWPHAKRLHPGMFSGSTSHFLQYPRSFRLGRCQCSAQCGTSIDAYPACLSLAIFVSRFTIKHFVLPF